MSNRSWGAWRFPMMAAFCVAAAARLEAAPVVDASTLRSASLAGTCAACHGRTDGPVPSLAGTPASRIVEAMQAFRHGTRDGTVMPQLARGYSDAQIEALAAFLAAQPKDRAP